MLYIKKIQLSRNLSYKFSRVRREQKSLIDKRTSQATCEVFDCFDKSLIRDSLIREQHGLCAYCMKRIDNTSFTTIEHWRPIEIDTEGALDYNNLFGVCDGGKKSMTQIMRNVMCFGDASKGKRKITVSPLNLFHM